ncbi:MAG: hypothetical protein LDLANPLL_00001 [Turneriella sp.]|nr:hypothetical protein [Turneriella sp.]
MPIYVKKLIKEISNVKNFGQKQVSVVKAEFFNRLGWPAPCAGRGGVHPAALRRRTRLVAMTAKTEEFDGIRSLGFLQIPEFCTN